MAAKILLVEDDPVTADYIAKGLSEQGHTVDRAADGREGLFLGSDPAFGLIILDRMLPGMSGIELLRALRAANVRTPVLILSALAALDDRIEGFDAGSDDYLVKPFAFSELLARVNALLRRAGPAGTGDVETKLVAGALELDLLARTARRSGREIELKPREYRLLEYLARNVGRVVTRTMLLEQVWDYHFDPGTNVIDVHVSRLRRKIDDGFDKPILLTVRGAGYRLAAD